MNNLTQEEVNKILELHEKWLDGEKDGEQANFSHCDLSGFCFAHKNLKRAIFCWANLTRADFVGADISFANFTGADLRYAMLMDANIRFASLSLVDLSYANLTSADLSYATLSDADLRYAILRKTDLTGADISGAKLNFAILVESVLFGADLDQADLRGADLTRANIRFANLYRANLIEAIMIDTLFSEETIGITLSCPEEGSFIGYAKVQDKIIVLEITADAKRSSATTKKCRCSKAKVIRIEELNSSISKTTSVISDWSPTFVYKLGEIVQVNDFDTNRWKECPTGIHFFMNKEIAKQY